MPHEHKVASLLEAWREAERRRDALPDGTPERLAAEAAVQQLQDEYLHAVDEQRKSAHDLGDS